MKKGAMPMLKMVIADDEAIICESLATMINWSALGIKISGIARNGVEALDAVMDTCPDIVLTDIRMPGLSGLTLIEKIRAADSDIEIIILSGYRDFEAAKTAMQHSVKHYLLKPITTGQLVSAVEKAKLDCKEKAHMRALKLEAAQSKDALSLALIQSAVSKLLACDKESAAKEMLDSFLSGAKSLEQMRVFGAELMSSLYEKKKSAWNWHGAFDAIYMKQDCAKLRAEIEAMAMDLLFPRVPEGSAVGKVKRYIADHISDDNLTLKLIASSCLYMNADHLSRLFVSETGEKFSQYLNRVRMERAKELLAAYGVSRISDVAQQVGCGGNPRYFSQVFKKYAGLTPSAFISSLKP
jgi:two-component system response regulator YesN